MKRILIGIDGSPGGWRALDVAITLANLYRAQLTALHVTGESALTAARTVYDRSVLSGESGGPLVPLAQTAENEATRRVHAILEQAREVGAAQQVTVDTVVVPGDPAQEILREAAKGYELIVLGYTRPPGIFGLPHVDERVVKRSPCSVLLVK